MPEVREISINDLGVIQTTNPQSLIVVYLQMDGVAQSSYDVFRTIAQRTPSHGERQIIFCRNSVDLDPTIQQTYAIPTVPTVIMFVGPTVVRRLDDLSEHMLEKHIQRHSM